MNNKTKKLKAKLKEILIDILGGTIIAGILLLILLLGLSEETEYTYAVVSDNEGIHYTNVTEKVCTVTEINGNLVTVDYKGNLYTFYGTGYIVGTEIVCTFNNANEIIDAK